MADSVTVAMVPVATAAATVVDMGVAMVVVTAQLRWLWERWDPARNGFQPPPDTAIRIARARRTTDTYRGGL